MKKTAFCLVVLLCGPCSSVLAEDYILSMPPIFSVEQLTAMLHPLAARLSKETENDISILLARNIDQYTAEVLHGNIVIGYENPSIYVNISNVHEAIASAVTIQHNTLSKGIIISRPESGISGLEDLKGKKIMIVSRESSGGFLSQKLTLKEKGIDVEWDCQLTEAANHREENVIISVSVGDVDAGFISEYALHKADQYIAPGSITSVAKTAPLPNWVVSISRKMPQIQKDDILEALLSLTPESPALKALGISAFKTASDADYDIIRNIIE
ncbi:MAG: phosphate/phosphite/phosphonate ABC transporter substrate-binding protein [Candidatus Electrothrix sp. AX5]|nr:phosphate/phosphite/phosphonate ABC transporter substrate-binding protein [Candidatus Electrothrix sp. AX5]